LEFQSPTGFRKVTSFDNVGSGIQPSAGQGFGSILIPFSRHAKSGVWKNTRLSAQLGVRLHRTRATRTRKLKPLRGDHPMPAA
jgi:hypothetical protein